MTLFQSTHPIGVRRLGEPYLVDGLAISIHAPLAGCDHQPRQRRVLRNVISIHAPLAGCDHTASTDVSSVSSFQSTHPAWGATPLFSRAPGFIAISIHAPRMGCDTNTSCNYRDVNISIHAPPHGVRRLDTVKDRVACVFQSTHPAWGATWLSAGDVSSVRFQSTHPAWGATLRLLRRGGDRGISIHAPRMGCDSWFFTFARYYPSFQSTHPAWGATRIPYKCTLHLRNFNPRTPHGVRPCRKQSNYKPQQISIHAPRMGCDKKATAMRSSFTHFNPRTPHGVRRILLA